MYLQNRNRHRQRKQTLAYQKEWGVWGVEKQGRDKLGAWDYYIKQICNKELLYSTGHYIQYIAILYNEEESEKEQIYLYIHN